MRTFHREQEPSEEIAGGQRPAPKPAQISALSIPHVHIGGDNGRDTDSKGDIEPEVILDTGFADAINAGLIGSSEPGGNGLEADAQEPSLAPRPACAECSSRQAGDDAAVIRRSPVAGDHAALNAARPGTSDALLDYLDASAGRGQPLPPDILASFEGSLGMGLSGVNVLADADAAAAADALGARAFTLGSTIWFGDGEYRPATVDGRRLLAHEVAHVAQQRAATPSIQREIVVGSAHDPAEAAADRAADAMMRGEPVASRDGTGGAVLRRTCEVSAASPLLPDVRTVTCPEGSWRVRRREESTPAGRQPETRVDGSVSMDETNIEFEGTVCRENTEFSATAAVNVPGAFQEALGNIVAGTPALSGVSIQPQLRLRLTRPRLRLDLQGGISIDASTRALQNISSLLTFLPPNNRPVSIGGDYQPPTDTTPRIFRVTIGIPLERVQRPPPRDCLRPSPDRHQVVFECRPIRPAQPASRSIPPVMRSSSTTLYALFPCGSADIVGWRFEGDSDNCPPDQVRARVQDLMLYDQFRPSAIVGYASPEGPRVQQSPSHRFAGNDSLSEARANAARRAIFDDICVACPTSSGGPIPVYGMSELHSPLSRDGQEVEGPRLARHATASFLAYDPLRPRDQIAFRAQPPQEQREQTFDLLRRAAIRFERRPIWHPGQPSVPGPPAEPGEPTECPAEIRDHAHEWFAPARRHH